MATKHHTPMLDQLESGPWPSFISGIKRLRDEHPDERINRVTGDLLGQLEHSYETRKGYWKGGTVSVYQYGGGIIPRFSEVGHAFPDTEEPEGALAGRPLRHLGRREPPPVVGNDDLKLVALAVQTDLHESGTGVLDHVRQQLARVPEQHGPDDLVDFQVAATVVERELQARTASLVVFQPLGDGRPQSDLAERWRTEIQHEVPDLLQGVPEQFGRVAERPERAEALSAAWLDWAARVKVYPFFEER